ncbi:MAG: hypothetical protein JWN48_4878 [Myxococcaceae bacterium]|nr:hypothetical protein [Myxococcaceae bacterium]
MKRAVFTFMLAVSAVAPQLECLHVARAEDDDRTIGKRVDDTKEAVTSAAHAAAQSAQEQASAAAESAKERAGEVAASARERASEAADSLSERARDVAAHAQDLAGALVESAKAKAEQLSEHAGDVLKQGRSAAGDALQGARDQAREVLISAAVALDNKSREAREAARKASWDRLKARFQLLGNRPSMVLSEELRDHEYRVARLRRARELASAVHDQAAVARGNLLLEQEYGRFKRRIEEIHARELAESKR